MRNPRNEPLGFPATADAGEPDSGPERRCILSGRTAPRDALVRLAVSPEGEVLPDALAYDLLRYGVCLYYEGDENE